MDEDLKVRSLLHRIEALEVVVAALAVSTDHTVFITNLDQQVEFKMNQMMGTRIEEMSAIEMLVNDYR